MATMIERIAAAEERAAAIKKQAAADARARIDAAQQAADKATACVRGGLVRSRRRTRPPRTHAQSSAQSWQKRKSRPKPKGRSFLTR